MSFGPDTHPTPLWDHPDYKFMGWGHYNKISSGGLHNENHLERRDPSGIPGAVRDDYQPVFRRKGGTGLIAVAHVPDVGSEFTHFPDDKNFNVTQTATTETSDGDIETSVATHVKGDEDSTPGTWSIAHRAGKSHPSILREMGGVIKLHHPGMNLSFRRTTGASASGKNAIRGFDMSRFTASEIERYLSEVFG